MKIAALACIVMLAGCASTPEEKARWRAISMVAGAYANASGVNYQAPTPTYDYSYAWDRVTMQYNNPVWTCRGIQTGQWAHESKCAYKAKWDYWPTN